jgi:predicted Zn-dependent protease
MRLQVVTVKPGETPAVFARRMAFADYQLDRFLALNGLERDAVLKPGDRVKIVVR